MKLFGLLLAALVGTASAFPTPANECGAVSPVPADQICAQRGRLARPYPLDLYPDNVAITQNSTAPAATCRNYCLNMMNGGLGSGSSCIAYAHNSKTELCVLYTIRPGASPAVNNLVDYGFKADPKSPFVFTSSACFNCTLKCGLPSSVNLLSNPAFNTSNKLIGPWGLTPFSSVGLIKTAASGNIVVFPNLPNINGGSFLSQPFSMCLNQDYLVSFDYKVVKTDRVKRTGSISAIGAGLGDSSTTYQLPQGDLALNSWQTITYSTRLEPRDPSEPALYFDISTAPGYETLLTNFNVRQIPPPHLLKRAGTPPLLQNFGFESGQISPWVVENSTAPDSAMQAVTSPGLPARPGIPTSNKKLSLAGQGVYDYYYRQTDGGSFNLAQNTTEATEPGALYLFTVEYLPTNCGLSAITIGMNSPDAQRYFQLRSGSYISSNGGNVILASRIYSGTGLVDQVLAVWQSPHSSFSVDIDNIGGITKLAPI